MCVCVCAHGGNSSLGCAMRKSESERKSGIKAAKLVGDRGKTGIRESANDGRERGFLCEWL